MANNRRRLYVVVPVIYNIITHISLVLWTLALGPFDVLCLSLSLLCIVWILHINQGWTTRVWPL